MAEGLELTVCRRLWWEPFQTPVPLRCPDAFVFLPVVPRHGYMASFANLVAMWL